MPQTTLVLGKHSGRHAVQKRCEQLGLTLSRHDLDEVYRRMVALADTQKHVTDDDLLAIAADVCGVAAATARRELAEAGYGFGVVAARSPRLQRKPRASAEPRLLDRHALRQIPRLIDVRAAADRHVVREQLQRHHQQHRQQQRVRVGHRQDDVALRVQQSVERRRLSTRSSPRSSARRAPWLPECCPAPSRTPRRRPPARPPAGLRR